MTEIRVTAALTVLSLWGSGLFAGPQVCNGFTLAPVQRTMISSSPTVQSSMTKLSSTNMKGGVDVGGHIPRRKFMGGIFTAATTAAALATGILNPLPASAEVATGGPIAFGGEELMSPKDHGTTDVPVQPNLRYGVSEKLADKICSYNRHFAEMGGYFESTSFRDEVLQAKGPLTFYDSVTGKPLFVAPLGRSAEEFLKESSVHGWPSFRDEEVVWDNVRVLKGSGETVSVAGTHLGHNLPDRNGNRYCINLVSIAGNPGSA